MKKILIIILCVVMLGTLITGCQENVGDEHATITGKQTIPETTILSDTEAGTETPEETTTMTETTEAETEAPKETTTVINTTDAKIEPSEETTDMETSILDREDSPYYGKIAVAYGDSITRGTFTDVGDPSPNSVVEKKWCDVVSERLGFKSLTNYGQNGISISSTSTTFPESALSLGYKKLRKDAEVIMIAAGTNDFGTHVKLGNITDEEDVSFCGGLNVLCKGLKERFPDSTIIFITPIDRKDAKSNQLGLSLDDYREKIEEIAGGVYGFIIVDGDCAGFDASDSEFISKYMRDGVHPNPEAHVIYGEAVAKELLTVRKK